MTPDEFRKRTIPRPSRADLYFAAMWCFLCGSFAALAVAYLIKGLPFFASAFYACASAFMFCETMKKVKKIRGKV